MKMETIDWVVREKRLRAFYGGDVEPEFRFLFWKLCGELPIFLQLYPRLATQSRMTQLWHLENYFIHAPAQLDEPAQPDVLIHPPIDHSPASIIYEDHGTPPLPLAFAA